MISSFFAESVLRGCYLGRRRRGSSDRFPVSGAHRRGASAPGLNDQAAPRASGENPYLGEPNSEPDGAEVVTRAAARSGRRLGGLEEVRELPGDSPSRPLSSRRAGSRLAERTEARV